MKLMRTLKKIMARKPKAPFARMEAVYNGPEYYRNKKPVEMKLVYAAPDIRPVMPNYPEQRDEYPGNYVVGKGSFCPECGTKNSAKSRFCSNCGFRLQKPEDTEFNDVYNGPEMM